MTTLSIDTLANCPVVKPEETGFTANLGNKYLALFEEFYQHPFLAGLRDGSASKAAVKHYVGQDFQYLTAYAKCYALGVLRSPNRSWMQYFHGSMGFVLDDESHAHNFMCDYIGIDYHQAQADRMAPTAKAYIDHMMQAGNDSLGVLLAALLPCPWTYIWSAKRFQNAGGMAQHGISTDHPLNGWWEFYAEDNVRDTLTNIRGRLDELAADASPAELKRMEEAFELSLRFEIRFWQMAQSQETW